MNSTTRASKIFRIAAGSLGLGAAVVFVFMGAPAEAVPFGRMT